MNLQRNRLEGTKYKPQDQMSWMEKAFRKGEFDEVYKIPHFQSKCHGGPYFPTERRCPSECRWRHHVVADG